MNLQKCVVSATTMNEDVGESVGGGGSAGCYLLRASSLELNSLDGATMKAKCEAILASASAMAARPWAPMCLSLAAEALVSVTSDADAVLRDHGNNNSDVRIGVYRAISSR